MIAAFLADAKHRRGMEVDAICAKLDQKGFAPLVGPNGRFFVVPHLLRPQDWESDAEAVAEVERKIHEAELASGLPMGRLVLAAAHSVGRAFSTPVRRVRRYALVRKVLKDNMSPSSSSGASFTLPTKCSRKRHRTLSAPMNMQRR